MRDKKYYIALDDFERRVVVNCLNEMRNNLIAKGKYTDAVDEVLLKIIDAKQKKFKVIYDEKNGIWYELQGDYYVPCLKLPEEEQQSIGVWGHRHLRYIKQHRKVLYLNLLTSGKLNGYLTDLDTQDRVTDHRIGLTLRNLQSVLDGDLDRVLDPLILADREEKLKANNQMEWVGRMNNIRSRAKEVINNELIFS